MVAKVLTIESTRNGVLIHNVACRYPGVSKSHGLRAPIAARKPLSPGNGHRFNPPASEGAPHLLTELTMLLTERWRSQQQAGNEGGKGRPIGFLQFASARDRPNHAKSRSIHSFGEQRFDPSVWRLGKIQGVQLPLRGGDFWTLAPNIRRASVEYPEIAVLVGEALQVRLCEVMMQFGDVHRWPFETSAVPAEARDRVAYRCVRHARRACHASRIHHQLRDKQLRASPTARLILHNDLDVASEQHEESHEAIE